MATPKLSTINFKTATVDRDGNQYYKENKPTVYNPTTVTPTAPKANVKPIYSNGQVVGYQDEKGGLVDQDGNPTIATYTPTQAAVRTGVASTVGPAKQWNAVSANNVNASLAQAGPAQQADVNKWDVDNTQLTSATAQRLIDENSPLMQQARTRGLQQANQSGLINSSMAVGAAQGAVMDRAVDIANRDASVYANAAQQNAQQANQVGMFNVGQANQQKQFDVGEANTTERFNVGQANDTSRYNAGQANQVGMYNVGQENQANQFNASQLQSMEMANVSAINQNSMFNAGATNAALAANSKAINDYATSNLDRSSREAMSAADLAARQAAEFSSTAAKLYSDYQATLAKMTSDPNVSAETVAAWIRDNAPGMTSLMNSLATLNGIKNFSIGFKPGGSGGSGDSGAEGTSTNPIKAGNPASAGQYYTDGSGKVLVVPAGQYWNGSTLVPVKQSGSGSDGSGSGGSSDSLPAGWVGPGGTYIDADGKEQKVPDGQYWNSSTKEMTNKRPTTA